MFSNLNWTNVVILLLLALFIFGDKLPHIIADGLRLLRKLRRMASDATGDLSRELGTDIRLEDLHPKTFIRKHVLNDLDTDSLVKPLKGLSDDLRNEVKGIERDFKEVSRGGPEPQRPATKARPATNAQPGAEPAPPAPAAPPPARTFDDFT